PKKCLQPQCAATLVENHKARFKYCQSCKVHFDRAAVEPENNAQICREQAQGRVRPAKYCRQEDKSNRSSKRGRSQPVNKTDTADDDNGAPAKRRKTPAWSVCLQVVKEPEEPEPPDIEPRDETVDDLTQLLEVVVLSPPLEISGLLIDLLSAL
ncbi:hypothetical protein BGZ73_001117, partial [Actinomortierella ambigua]